VRAAVVTKARKLEVMDVSDPKPGPYQCLVKMDACAICTGTDSNIISGNFPWLVETPFILGHESTGVIVQIGEGVRNFKAGQRVTRPAGILPGERRDDFGSNWGGFAELGLVVDTGAAKAAGLTYSGMIESSRCPLPRDVDPVSAALSVNQREIMSVVEKLDVGPESRIVVLGSGYNGLLFSLFLRTAGAGSVLVTGSAGRERVARETFEADLFVDYRQGFAGGDIERLLGGKPDYVIDAVGTVRSMSLAQAILGPDSAFGRYGLHEFDRIGQLTEEITSRHRILDLSANEVSATGKWHRLWRKGFFNRAGMCDGTVPLDQIGSAFDKLARRAALKMVVTM